ncbi:MAG: hypothetical protein RBQ70_05400 [Acholeplasma sp.]|jgi:hypothetical protein|nr:hypothetical protein [Acholeplasma sp.]
MNKKIRAVVKHYEKNMKFESKFEQLSHKLDLIKDDTPLKSDVIVIRRKLIPAYMMSVLVMALVTGLIGLQIGLGNLKVKTEYINPVEVELQKRVDIYLTNSIYSSVIGNQVNLNYYIGLKNEERYLLINMDTIENYGDVNVIFAENSYDLVIHEELFWILIPIGSTDVIDLEIVYTDNANLVHEKNINFTINEHFDFLLNMYN